METDDNSVGNYLRAFLTVLFVYRIFLYIILLDEIKYYNFDFNQLINNIE